MKHTCSNVSTFLPKTVSDFLKDSVTFEDDFYIYYNRSSI